jgi:autotransporter-associated beta strand protein
MTESPLVLNHFKFNLGEIMSKSEGSLAVSIVRRLFTSLFLFVVIALGLQKANGAVLSWSGGGGNGAWNNSGNWGFAGTPGNGDTLVFPAGQPFAITSNNIVGLVLNQIRFAGAGGGYILSGNSFTLTNSIQATNTAGANTINNNISITTTDIVINVTTTLTYGGSMSGSVGVIKNGAGTLDYEGSANPYTGTTLVNAGILILGNGDFNAAFGGPLVIGDGSSSATVRLGLDLEIPSNQPITINNNGLLDLNNLGEDIGNSLTMNASSSITTGTATLSLAPNATVTANMGVFSGCTISGNLNVSSGTCTFIVNPAIILSGSMAIPASVSGTATIVKTGGGFLSLSGANSFSGAMNIAAGTLGISHPLALGLTNGPTTVSNSATLQISASVTNEALTIASSGIGVINASGANIWVAPPAVPINLAAATTMEIDGVSLDFRGQITGSGGFTKTGAGTLRLSGPGNNSYLGDTTVTTGILELNAANVIRFGTLTIGDGLGGASADVVRYVSGFGIFGGPGGSTVVITPSGLLDLNGFSDDVGPIVMKGGAAITTGIGTLSLFEPLTSLNDTNGGSAISGNFQFTEDSIITVSNTLTMNAVLSSAGTTMFTKTGSGTMNLMAANTYSGLTVVQQGFLWAQNSGALGDPSSGVIVSNGASLVLSGGIGITNKALTLNGPGVSTLWGALDAENGGNNTNFWTGPITLNASSTVFPFEGSVVLKLQGPISGPGGLLVNDPFGAGTLVLEGAANNTYAGTTTLAGGTLVLNHPAFSNSAIPGNINVIGGTLLLAANEQINDAANVTVDAPGTFNFSGFFDSIDRLNGNGSVIFGTSGFVEIGAAGGSSTFDGLISGTGFVGGYTVGKFGAGTFTMNGDNTYLNQSKVFAGTMVINGNQPQSPAVVNSGATLRGSGTVGTISASGNIAPGSSSGIVPGILNSSNVTFTGTGILTVDLTGPNPGTGYDQLNVTGSNVLANAGLSLFNNFTSPVAVGDQFVILNNDGVEPISGTFSGLPSGASISTGGYIFTISYTGGNGNDVVLTLTNVPAGAGASFVTLGNGDHAISPNECNAIDLVISNKIVGAMSGVTATLSTVTPGVAITQPYSDYPDIPGLGSRTNITPFQISTFPSFACGTDINLELIVNTGNHGSFIVPFVVHSGSPSVVPVRFDNNTITNVPDVGAIESTNNVGIWSGGPLTKIAVSLWLVAPFDSDMNLTLIAPNGASIDLSSGNGGGANFGTGSADGSRTTFDDAAGTSITAGSSPFVGTFRPEVALSNLISLTVAGDWRLRIQDNFGSGSVDTLRAWSLFLYGTSCGVGAGECDVCLPLITNSITLADLTQTNRIFRNSQESSCGSPKLFPGTVAGVLHYDAYTFTNTSTEDACVTVELSASCDLEVAAYLGSFDPGNINSNYIGDSGSSTAGSIITFSSTVPAGAQFVVTVNEVNPNAGCGNYTLRLSGLPCPAPTLAITPLSNTNNVRIDWSTSAGGFKLESSTNLSTTNWVVVPNEPIELNSRFAVTNSSAIPTNRFYRLHKP